MKKISGFLLIASLAFATSCKKDDDSSNFIEINETNLKGKWELVSTEENGKTQPIESCDDKHIMNLAFNQSDSNWANFIAYIKQGEQCISSVSINYNWEITNNIFTTFVTNKTLGNIRFEEDTFTVIELNSTTLKLKTTETYIDNQGKEQTSIYIDTYTNIGEPDPIDITETSENNEDLNNIDPSEETDNTTAPYTEPNFTGEWNLISEEKDGNIYTITSCNDRYVMALSFKSDGGNLAKYKEYTEQGEECIASTSWDYVWEISGDQFTTYTTTNSDDRYDEDVSTILELTSTTLKLRSTETYIQNGIEQTSVYIETFTKI